jgi:hypothetical protein
MAVVLGWSAKIQDAGTLQTLELQAGDVPAGCQAGRVTKEDADGGGMVLEAPREAIHHVFVADRQQFIHVLMEA